MVTDQNGQIVERHDYMPFGEEIINGFAGRGALWGATAGAENQKFTGKERDAESGLDYFGARYYGSALGRFTSADPLYIEAHRLVDPQRLNLYTYGNNNPLTLVDEDGLDVTCSGDHCANFYSALQQDVSFKIGHDDDGKVTASDVGKKLSKRDKAVLEAIRNKNYHVEISTEGGAQDGSVRFGSTDHVGHHVIAFDQTSLLDAAGGPATTADVVGHEVLEGFAEAKAIGAYTPPKLSPHDYANGFFPGFDPPDSPPRFDIGQTSVSGYTERTPLHGAGVQYDVHYQFVTPIPKSSIPQMKAANESATDRPRYPTDVKKVQ